MRKISRQQLEMLKMRYPKGTRVCLDHMEGEKRMASGLKGSVEFVDAAGQIHVRWENGSSLALIPGADRFHKEGMPDKKKGKEMPSR